jgi:hypothetical protein
LGLLAGAAISLLILASSLSTLSFRLDWLGVTGSAAGGAGPGANPNWDWLKFLFEAGVIALAVLFVLSLLFAPRSQLAKSRRNYSLLFLLFLIAVFAILRPEALRAVVNSLRVIPPADQSTPAPVSAPSPPAAGPLVYVASLAAAALLMLLAWGLWKAVRRLPEPASASVPRQVAQTAQAALQALHAGAPLPNVIMRCYRDMNRLVAEHNAVVRDAAATPREFVERMEEAGVPGRPAEQLTTLFEAARYSARPMGPLDEAEAEACLQALAAALEPGREGGSPSWKKEIGRYGS